MLSKSVPTHAPCNAMWRLPEEHLEEAQDDANHRRHPRHGGAPALTIVTDGRNPPGKAIPTGLRTALEGIDIDKPRDHRVAVGP